MSYKCKFCSKSFNSKQNLEYHYDNNVCVDKGKILCKICVKYYKNKYTYKRHCKIKHPELFNINKKDTINKIVCENCNKEFARKYNLKMHLLNNVCKKDSIILNSKTNCNNTNIVNNINNTNNTNNTNHTNIVNNNIINISLNSFGNEDISSISNDELIDIVKRCYNSVSELFKRIHIDIPENRNIYLSNYKEGNISVYKNGKWNIHDAKKVLKKIQDINIDIIDTFYKSNIGDFTNNKSIERMIEDFNNNKLTNKYNKDIKLILENNKGILKESKEIQSAII